MTRELVLWLLEQGHQPVHLRPRITSGVEALTLGLQEAIALRERGESAISLQLLQKLQSEGFDSGWISDNAARALVDLEQIPQAVSIWEQLIKSDDPEVAGVACDTLQKVLQPFLQELDDLCRRHSWQRKHLPEPNSQPADNFTLALLNEAIATREANRTDLSLALIEAALRRGWDNPWLHDNQARALVHQGRRTEACAIWARLQHHDDPTAAAEARNMLGQYEPRRISHPIREQIEALDQDGKHDEAEQLLLETLVSEPDDTTLWALLEQRQSKDAEHPNGLLDQELAAVNKRLAAEEQLLAYIEAKLALPAT